MNWIISDNNPLIREKCKNVVLPLTDSDYHNIKKMVSYIEHSYNGNYDKYNIVPGVAIAANQIGMLKKIVYLHFDDEFGIEKQWLFINPIVIEKSEEITYLSSGEGCLSVPIHRNGIVPRSYKIKIKTFELLTNKNICLELSGYSAIVVQHELDHLEGKLYYDHINVLDPNYHNKKWIKI